MLSDCENLAADKKLFCSCCKGLLFEGLNPPRAVRAAPGMFTGAELPNRPAEASPTDIEFETVGDSVSNSLSSAERFRSSKWNSSNAFPIKKRLNSALISL